MMTFWKRQESHGGEDALRQALEQQEKNRKLAQEVRTTMEALKRMNQENNFAKRLEAAYNA